MAISFLNEYRRLVTVRYRASGCVEVTEGPAEFVGAIGCCGDCEEGTGTGTGAGGTTNHSLLTPTSLIWQNSAHTGEVHSLAAFDVSGHAIYLPDDSYDTSGAAVTAVAAHEAASDPHPQYLTQAEGDARYIQIVGAVASVFGRTGAVVAVAGDYTAAQVTNAADVTAANIFLANQAIIYTDATTTGVIDVVDICHNSSATPAAGFGAAYRLLLKSSTTNAQEAVRVSATWAMATHASRKARVVYSVYDTAAREFMRAEASGSAAMVGFLGAAASAQLASPDAGTALVTFGLASGTCTFALANLTGAAAGVLTFLATPSSANLRAALTDEVGAGAAYFVGGALGTPASGDLSSCTAFVAAGGSHAKGVVPDPGATAHTNFPFSLRDDGTFKINTGEILGTPSYVTTSQTTTSTTLVDLATAQTVSFTLDAACDVIVTCSCTLQNNTAGNASRFGVDVDGVDEGAQAVYTVPTANVNYTACTQWKISLASGARTIKMQFSVGGGTGTFLNRLIKVERVT